MMNRLYKIVLGLFVCIPFVACNEQQEENGAVLTLDKSEIVFAAEGGTDVVLVESRDSWNSAVSEPWLSVSPASGQGSMACNVVVDSSLVDDVRTAVIRFTPSTALASYVTVKQMGYEKMIVPENSEIRIESSADYDKRYFETTVTTNVQFGVEVDLFGAEQEWLTAVETAVELDKGARPRSAKLRFDWKMNTAPVERVAEIRLVPQGEGAEEVDTAVISVIQKPALKIEDNRAGDSIALVVIYERMNCWSDAWDTSDNIQHWEGVKLWEASDEEIVNGEVPQAAVGRVRAVQYSFLNTKETIPAEIRHLKYLESLAISSNVNTMLLNIELGSEICELDYLKYLTIFSYGIVSLPDDFVKLGKSLVALDLSANNFSSIPAMLTQENFPKLKSLSFVASRRWNTTDLRKKDDYENGVGLNINASTDNVFRQLFLWENLEELSFSNSYIEGELPDFTVGQEGVVAYTQKDVDAWGGDTIQYLADNAIPKILPNCTMLRLNLNFLTGDLPQWLLYHPRLLDWAPDILIFNQQEKGLNSAGEPVRFNNEPQTFDYYYDVFPGTREKYELKDEITEE